ncbi:MAG: hypothetical protein AAF617_15670 [Bacteroidota bacterium]
MKSNIIAILFIFFSVAAIAQRDADMRFVIEFEVNVEEKICYENAKQFATKNVDLNFYLLYSWPIKGQLEKLGSNRYRITGEFTFLVGGSGMNFLPVLVCMAEPKFKMQSEKCNNKVTTYFIDLSVLHTKKQSQKIDYELTAAIGKINLGEKPFIKATQTTNKIQFTYSKFFPTSLQNSSMGYWLKL